MNHLRRAATLIELLVVMTAVMTVISLSSGLLCRMMRIQIETRTQVDVERNALRLAEQFRRDVHAANAIESSGDGHGADALFALEFPDGRRAEYFRRGESLLRTVTAPGRPPSRDEFVFPETCDIAVREDQDPQRLSVIVTTGSLKQPPGRPLPVPVSLQVTATLGRDLRFITSSAEQEAIQ